MNLRTVNWASEKKCQDTPAGCSGLVVTCLTAVHQVQALNPIDGSSVFIAKITATMRQDIQPIQCTPPRLTQPSSLCGTVKGYQLSRQAIMINVE